MIEFINKIKQFFKNIILRNKVKQLEEPKEEIVIKQDEKKKFFEMYEKVKKNEYDLNNLTEEQAQKVITMLKSEINLKKDKLNNDVTELNILKIDNKIAEKNRIFEIYNGIKNETIDLKDIDKEDLLKIRKLLIEEAKIQDGKIEEEISLLELTKKIS